MGGLYKHKQIKATVKSSNRFKVFTNNNPKDYNNPLAYWNSRYLLQLYLAHFILNILAIPLISVEYKRVFFLAKYLITNSQNCLKADIIKANKCLKSQFRCPILKLFK